MDDESDRSSTFHVSSLQRTIEQRIANPALLLLLRSRVHWIASRWFALVSYEGHRTGHRYTFPVMFYRRGDSAVVVTPKREGHWWKNFAQSRPCRIWLRGSKRSAVGELATGTDRETLLAGYLDHHPFAGRLLGISAVTDRGQSEELAVVRFTLSR